MDGRLAVRSFGEAQAELDPPARDDLARVALACVAGPVNARRDCRHRAVDLILGHREALQVKILYAIVALGTSGLGD